MTKEEFDLTFEKVALIKYSESRWQKVKAVYFAALKEFKIENVKSVLEDYVFYENDTVKFPEPSTWRAWIFEKMKPVKSQNSSSDNWNTESAIKAKHEFYMTLNRCAIEKEKQDGVETKAGARHPVFGLHDLLIEEPIRKQRQHEGKKNEPEDLSVSDQEPDEEIDF